MRPRKLLAPFFALAGLALVPWTVWLTFHLPSHHETADWQTVWAGFDLAEAGALIAVAVSALRRSPWLEAAAAIAGTLLCTDAWFDITLEAGGKHMVSSIVEAAIVELPLAAICFWIALDSERALARAMPPWHRAVMRALVEPDEEYGTTTSRDGLQAPGRASPRPHTPDPHPPEARSPAE